MGRFSHIRWFEWVLYSLFSVFCIILVSAAIFHLQADSSPFLPIYAYQLGITLHLGNLVCAVPGLIGIFRLLFKKAGAWQLIFFSVTGFVLLPFVPIRTLQYEYLPRPDYSALFFLLIPVTLLSPRTREFYNIGFPEIIRTTVFILVVLVLRFISFDVFLLFRYLFH